MPRTVSPGAGRAGLLSLAACFVALASATPGASAEIVSKQPGASGLPFPSSMADASTDGRYVVLNVGDLYAPPAGTGPEVSGEVLGGYTVIRDRVADTLTPLVVRAAPGGAPITDFRVMGISDDGDRVLVWGSDPALIAFSGPSGQAVYDRSEDRLLALPTAPTGTGLDSPVLSADGTQVLGRAYGLADGRTFTIVRGPVGGVASVVVDLPGLMPEVGVSADLQTVVYRRSLVAAKRPAAEADRVNEFSGQVIGVRVGSQAPRVVAETTRKETLTGGECGPGDQGVETTDEGVQEAYASPDGSRIGWLEWHDGEWQTAVRSADGAISFVPKPANAILPKVIAFGNATQAIWNPPSLGAYAEFQQELVKGDTELIGSSRIRYPTPEQALATRYVTAEPFASSPAPAGEPITFTTEPTDTAARASQATWASCVADAAAPVGAFSDYVEFVPGRYSWRSSIGPMTVRTTPKSTLRAASKIKVDLSWFGIPYWQRTVTAGSGSFGLPKPFWGVPMTLKVTVQPKAVPGEAAPAPLTRSYSIFTVSF